MEDKIEVGEFVKTKKGQIDKLHCEINGDSWRSKDEYGNLIARCENNKYWVEDIVKHSKNIIDLIEVGDYVNGHLVKAVYLEGTTKYIKLDNSHNSIENNFAGIRTYEQDIKEIVTKEQFESVAYKIEED